MSGCHNTHFFEVPEACGHTYPTTHLAPTPPLSTYLHGTGTCFGILKLLYLCLKVLRKNGGCDVIPYSLTNPSNKLTIPTQKYILYLSASIANWLQIFFLVSAFIFRQEIKFSKKKNQFYRLYWTFAEFEISGNTGKHVLTFVCHSPTWDPCLWFTLKPEACTIFTNSGHENQKYNYTGHLLFTERCRFTNNKVPKLQYFIRGTFRNLFPTGGVVWVQLRLYI